jgi:phage baseplate assembly protein W
MAGVQEERDAVRRRLLGWTLACAPVEPGDHGRDLVPAKDNQGRIVDLAPVRDVDCLGQSLTVALTTALGSDIFNTSFGFNGLRALTDGTVASLARETLRIAVIDVLRAAPRVARILDVGVPDERDPGDPNKQFGTLEATVAFETVAGERVDLTLGGGGAGG